jgi:hypothetical protein
MLPAGSVAVMPDQQISMPDVVSLSIALARRWDVLKIPENRIVRVVNFRLRAGRPTGQPGIVTIEIAPGLPAGIKRIENTSFDMAGASLDESLARLVEWLQDQIDAHT